VHFFFLKAVRLICTNFFSESGRKHLFITTCIEKQCTGTRLYGRDHFGAARFVVALFGIAHFVDSPFWSRPFYANFTKIIFSFYNFSIFFIYKN